MQLFRNNIEEIQRAAKELRRELLVDAGTALNIARDVWMETVRDKPLSEPEPEQQLPADRRSRRDYATDPLPHESKYNGPGFRRRNNLLELIDTEHAIRHARQHVEILGAHPLLTDASTLLGQALDKVADFVERRYPSEPEGPGPFDDFVPVEAITARPVTIPSPPPAYGVDPL